MSRHAHRRPPRERRYRHPMTDFSPNETLRAVMLIVGAVILVAALIAGIVIEVKGD